MKKLGIGLLGYGFVQREFHVPCYREIAETNIVAVGGRTKGAVEFADALKIKNAYFGDDFIEKLCSDPEVDVVDIGLPNFLHKKAVILAAENGKHVICEKPLACNAEDAKAMLRAVEKAGVIHCYAENQVFMPQITRVKEFIANGAVGNVFWVRNRCSHFGPYSSWFWNPELAGGGVLMDLGCHSIEVAQYLIGKKPVEAYAWGAALVHKTAVEDNSLALVKYEGGELGQSENSWATHGGFDLRCEVYGSEGVCFVDATRETGIRVFTMASKEKVGYVTENAGVTQGWAYTTWREHEVYGYLPELQHFVSCILKGETPRENFENGYKVNCILDACYRAMKSGKWEPVNFNL